MFDKHEFTCPDVIYLRKKAQKQQLIAIAIQLGFWGSIFAWGKTLEARDKKSLIDSQTLSENQE